MASYSFNVSIIRRSKKQSIVNSIAYIYRDRLIDSYTEKAFDYRARKRDLVCSGCLLPEQAPTEFQNIRILLRELNAAERRKDAQLAQNLILALPVELDTLTQKKLIMDFCHKNFIDKGRCVCYAIHSGISNQPGVLQEFYSKGQLKNNPHAHLIVPFRSIDEGGFCKTKTNSRSRDSRAVLMDQRKQWADLQNEAYESCGLDRRVSHLSLKDQGIARKPTRHLSPITLTQESSGIVTKEGNMHLETIIENTVDPAEKKRFQQLLEERKIRLIQQTEPAREKTLPHPIPDRLQRFEEPEVAPSHSEYGYTHP